ncbi:MAG: phosphoglucosamine mutase [Oligoflexales bacterium]|nr:phosphoglucosamine mutase [Oligoflexales bacterium]
MKETVAQDKVENRVKLFGTDGIRGRANVYPMSPELVLRLGQALGLYFKKHYEKPRILIGKDTRKSGYMLEQALSSGICSVGVDTFFLGPLPTPGIAYLTRGMRANAGIVISASHNAYFDNGIKIFSADGYKLPDEVEEKLESLVFDSTLNAHLPTGKAIGTTQRIDDAIGQYAVFLKEQFPKHLTLEGVRIVLDCANGAAYKVAPKVFEELGAEVFLIGANPDGTNINEDCGAVYPKRLIKKVKLYKADIGIAVDGDADRVIVVDEKGELLDGDEVMAICGIHYLEQKRLNGNAVVATIMSNMGLDIAMSRHQGKVVRTQVGDRYVVEEMRKNNYNLGGEQSGHMVFRDCSTTGDGILAALCLLEILIEKGQGLHDLKKCMERLPQVLKSFAVDKKVPLPQLPDLTTLIKQMEQSLGKEGRVLFRYSGTEKKARIMIEGSDRDQIESMVEELAEKAGNMIKQAPAVLSNG